MEEFAARRWMLMGGTVGIAAILIIKLFFLQLIDTDLKAKASDIGKKILYPSRGIIFDRKNNLIVRNKPIYDVLVIQKNVEPLDTLKFCKLLGIEKPDFVERMRELKENKKNYFSRYKPELFVSQVPAENIIAFEEHLYEFAGFFTNVKEVRSYPFSSGAHIIGDIGEVSASELEKSNGYYLAGDQIGKAGLERSFENKLRGKKGVKYYYKDKLGREIADFSSEKFDSIPIAGSDLHTTLDIALQEYGEYLMNNKRGSIVAIEPATGEILAMVSSPSYDPALLVGRERGKHFIELSRDTLNRPLINRPVTARYPPGSIFKPLMALIALNEGAITFQGNGGYFCSGGGWVSGSLRVKCHSHPPIGNANNAIQYSCNAYYCNAFKRLLELDKFKHEGEGLDAWSSHLTAFHLGKQFSIELPNTSKGLLPNSEFYDKIYKGYRWKATTIISLAIGQGELLVTPLHMANMYAILANRGWYVEPHLVRRVGSEDVTKNFSKRYTKINSTYFDMIIDGMQAVVENGTARRAFIPGIPVLGKTGTAQNPHGEDHSIFAAFAPRDNPKIAIAVVVENSGFGGVWSAPIASLMIEKYIRGTVDSVRRDVELKMHNAVFTNK